MTDNSPTQDHNFSKRLVSIDPIPSDLKSDIQQELNTMFERKLTLPRRISFTIVSVLALISAAVCGFLAITEPELPALGRIGLSVGTLFGMAWAAIGIRILNKGTLDPRGDNKVIAAMAWNFTVLMVVFFLIGGMTMADRLLGIMMIGQALAFLIAAAVVWLSYRIEQCELSTREKLLQIELMLAELHERD